MNTYDDGTKNSMNNHMGQKFASDFGPINPNNRDLNIGSPGNNMNNMNSNSLNN